MTAAIKLGIRCAPEHFEMTMNRAQREEEAVALARWCLCVTGCLGELGVHAIPEMENAIRKALATRSVTPLRSVKRDLTEWVRGLTPKQRLGIEEALRAQVGAEFSDEETTDRETVKQVLERGKIQNQVEYRLLSQWIDRLIDDESKKEEVAKIDALLTQFGTRII